MPHTPEQRKEYQRAYRAKLAAENPDHRRIERMRAKERREIKQAQLAKLEAYRIKKVEAAARYRARQLAADPIALRAKENERAKRYHARKQAAKRGVWDIVSSPD